ncbi:MAG: hypothetical protein ABSD89_05965 [Halobacteriota archaeon]
MRRISHDQVAASVSHRDCRPAITMIVFEAPANVSRKIGQITRGYNGHAKQLRQWRWI